MNKYPLLIPIIYNESYSPTTVSSTSQAPSFNIPEPELGSSHAAWHGLQNWNRQ